MPNVDTLKAYETLTQANMPDEQARAVLAVVKTVQEAGSENLLTQTEFKEEVASLRLDMQSLRTEIFRVKFDLLKWIIPILLGQIGLTVAILIRLLK